MIVVLSAALLASSGILFAEGGGGTKVDSGTCLSGMKWTGGDSESPEMHPGGNCISCHAAGEGPRFVVAGTVYRALNEPTDCYGVQGATVQLTDAKGTVFTMTSNKAGNFMLRARGKTPAMPFTAQVSYKGQVNAMGSPQSTGDCAACHTAAGNNGAPGRVIIPGG
jgi:hypothetical protein